MRQSVEHHFRQLGMSERDAAARAALVDLAERGFHRAIGRASEWRWFVPGRIEIFGKHTDYAGGRSLLCTVPRGIAVAASPRTDRVVRVIDLQDLETITIDLEVERDARAGLDNYASVVARRLALNFPDAQLGIDLAIRSDLPRAAGVSSSSALVVGIASALITRGSLETRREWLDNIGSIDDRAWYLGCVENGLNYRGLPSSSGVGTLGGSEDHTAILACKTDHVSQYRFVPVQHINDVRMPGDWTFVVASSGVHADKAGGVRELYNRASRATHVLLDIWNAEASTLARSLGEALSQDPSALHTLRDLVLRTQRTDFATDALEIRLRHFAAEDARIPEAAHAFDTADADALGALAAESQRDTDLLLGNQVPQTRQLVASAVNSGAIAASAFGAGFGGSVWALVARDEADQFANDWLATYRASFPQLTTAESFVARPGPPLTELPA